MQPKTSVHVWIGIVIAMVIAIAGFLKGGGQAPAAGAVNGGNVTNFTAVQTDAGYWVGNNQIASATGILASSIAQFDGGILASYTNSTSTRATSQTLIAADILNYTTVIMTPNVGSDTITLPASSTLSAFVPTAGDWAQQCWVNGTSTATTNITFAAGTGIDLEYASSTSISGGAANLSIAGGNSGCFRYIRKATTDIIAQFTAFVDAD